MAVSKIEICNVALAMLGADAIRSFDEKNKRARMSDVFFDFTRDYLLTKFDWPFAKRFVKLQPLDDTVTIGGITTDRVVPDGMYPYQLPADCHTPRDMHPPGSKDPWDVMEDVFYCKVEPTEESAVYLYYTSAQIDVSKYSRTFNNLLALGLALKMCPAITQDKQLTAALGEQFAIEQQNAWESDANIGNMYREHDEDPNNDSFVYPDGVTPIDDPWR